MVGRVSGPELADVEALYELEPWCEERADLRSAMLAAVMANAWSTGKRFKPSDFMPDFDASDPEKAARRVRRLKEMVQLIGIVWNAEARAAPEKSPTDPAETPNHPTPQGSPPGA